jgi:hypothetical protein
MIDGLVDLLIGKAALLLVFRATVMHSAFVSWLAKKELKIFQFYAG